MITATPAPRKKGFFFQYLQQSPDLQFTVWVFSPLQSRPFSDGAGLSQDLTRILTPKPHDLVQALHADHSPQFPSSKTGNRKIFVLNNDLCLYVYIRCATSARKRINSVQSAKKIIFTARHSGKLKLAFTSPDIISTSPKSFLTSRIDFTVLLLFEFLKKHHLPIGQVKNSIH